MSTADECAAVVLGVLALFGFVWSVALTWQERRWEQREVAFDQAVRLANDDHPTAADPS